MKLDFRNICPHKLFPILMLLEEFSDENYIVGGAVRDLWMKKTPNDWDVVTDIPMDKLIELFEDGGFKVTKTGIAHLVLNVHFSEFVVEISNFRKDKSCDGRHADVEVGDIKTDAFRRDFTVNSLFINTKTLEVLDPTGQGLDDINNRVLRFVGNPKGRINQDYLRCMRYYRFLSKGFKADKKSLKAVREMWNEAYEKTTAERVRVEIEKMVL